jgi:hypothetical protein
MANNKAPKENGQPSDARRLKRVLSPDVVEALGLLRAFELDLLAEGPGSVSAR